MRRYASPTFLFRHQCPDRLGEIMGKLKQCGFDGIELYGMFGYGPEEISRYCHEYDISVLCDHIHYPAFTQQTEHCIRQRAAMGVHYLTVDSIPEELLPGTEGWPEARGEIQRISRMCKDYGIQLLYHNHGYDLIRKVGGEPTLDLILDDIAPELLQFQPDLGWLSLGGGDSARYLRKYRDRCPIIHLKDYYSAAPILLESPFLLGENRGGEEYQFFEFRPSGYGVMNYPQLMPLVLECRPEWITLDHDMSYERDVYTDMAMSLRYVKELVSLHSVPQSD